MSDTYKYAKSYFIFDISLFSNDIDSDSMNFIVFSPKICSAPLLIYIIVFKSSLNLFYVKVFSFKMFIVYAEYVFLKISESRKSYATFLA